MLLPAMIREQFPDISIGFFLHIPFPSYEIYRTLPWRAELLNGVLGSDQIGFHEFNYMRHFLSATYRICGHEHEFGRLRIKNRIVSVDVFPMGINYNAYAHGGEVASNGTDGHESDLQLQRLAGDRKVILSVDRYDCFSSLFALSAFNAHLQYRSLTVITKSRLFQGHHSSCAFV